MEIGFSKEPKKVQAKEHEFKKKDIKKMKDQTKRRWKKMKGKLMKENINEHFSWEIRFTKYEQIFTKS